MYVYGFSIKNYVHTVSLRDSFLQTQFLFKREYILQIDLVFGLQV